jgi:hypothetical protein
MAPEYLMTESEAIAIAEKYVASERLNTSGVIRAVFEPADERPLSKQHLGDAWMVLFSIPIPAGVLDMDPDFFVIEVNVSTGTVVSTPMV